MRSKIPFLGILLLVNVSCSDSGDNPDGGGSAGQATTGGTGSGGSGSGGKGSGGSANGGSGGSGGSASGGKSGGNAGSAGTAGGSGALEGVCGQRGEATVMTGTFEGTEEFYIIGDEGFGTDVCVVQFDVTRAGDAPQGCVDLEGEPCLWTHRVAYSNPVVVLDEDGACANRNPGPLDEDGIAAIDGTEASYGYVFEFQGHNSVVLKHDAALDSWEAFGNAGYDEETGMFTFTHPEGFCTYSAPP